MNGDDYEPPAKRFFTGIRSTMETLKLSLVHEKELVAKAIELNSARAGIKWHYETYRPEDYKCHNEKRDWNKNCRIKRQTVLTWMKKFKKSGNHRQRPMKNQMDGPTRPESGPNSMPVIKLTDDQKDLLIKTCTEQGQSARKAIKEFFRVHFPKEHENHDLYNDWDKCSIKKSTVMHWVKNVSDLGCIKKSWTYPSEDCKQSRQLGENLLVAEKMIDEIKNSSEGNKDLAVNLTASKLAGKMGISRSSANKYLNILEGERASRLLKM